VGGSGGAELHALWEAFKGCSVVLGMLALGLGLARLPGLMATISFALTTILVRLAVWPATAAAVVALHALGSELLEPSLRLIAPLFAALPCATSGAIFVAELDLEIGKVAACVLASTVLALLTLSMVAMLPVLLSDLL
jgi:predicted permease